MRKMMKTGMVFFMAMMVLMVPVTADTKAKVLNKKMTIDLNKDSAGIRFAPTKLKKYSKVKVSVKNKKVLKAKANGRKYIYLKGKAGGRTTMMIRLYKGHKKVRVYRYSIKVIGKGQDGYKAQASGKYIGGATIGYYEENDRWNTSKRITVGESGRRIVLEIGKTYVFYEKTTPDGYDKAEKVTITVTKDMPREIILSDN